MELYHNSRKQEYRSPYGAVAVGTTVTISLDAPEAERVYLRLWTGSETLIPMTKGEAGRFTAKWIVPETPGLLWYYFRVDTAEETVFYGVDHGGTGKCTDQPESWQITVYAPQPLPEWYRNAVVYQIFPDRFARGEDWLRCQENAAHPAGWKGTRRMVMQEWNDTPFYCRDEKQRVTRWPFFGGNLQGILKKLPYLKSLGVGAIYLNPIFLASSNHKYDTADYLTIDPGFGTEEDFRNLCAQAKEMGIRVILDGVFSHTGDDSIYFNRFGNYPQPGAYGSAPSPYDDWYRFGEANPAGYECWWGVDSLPDVEELNPGYQELICGEDGVIRKWLRLGASGWRLDVADELPDSFIAAIRKACKTEQKDALLLGEVWEDASHKISYDRLREYLLGQELDCTMHYPFRDGAVAFLMGQKTAGAFAEEMESIRENYPETALYGALNLVGTHDTPRILTVLGEAPEGLSEAERENYRLPPDKRDMALRRLRLLDELLFAFPGVPCVYYGDEAGMEGYADPFNRGTFPWGREDGDLQYHVRMLSNLRKEYPVLTHGTARYAAVNDAVFLLERRWKDAKVELYVNQSWTEQTVEREDDGLSWLDLLTGTAHTGKTLTIAPCTAVMLYREGTQKTYSPLPELVKKPKGKGILCPLFSLPGGTMGQGAYDFLDAIHQAGYQNWMLLPLCPVGDGDSPYSSRGIFAGDPRYIDPDGTVDMAGYADFCRNNAFWLEDYVLFTVLRRVNENRPWQCWPKQERNRTGLPALRRRYAKELEALRQEQYRFFCQWNRLKRYAEKLDIALIGDLPIYAAVDGADTWAHRELFQLDEQGYPTLRAGCPPDYFTPEGQDWGNPLYDWERMARDGYDWWAKRVQQALSQFDFVRMDHFRGFAAYYAIPAEETAKSGYWMKGPGVALFRTLAEKLGQLPIIAEDLGALDSQVTVLLRHTGLPGMNVWQFNAREMVAMPPEEAENRVFFSGTHDNQTLRGFLETQGSDTAPEEILNELLSSHAAAVILPVQDVLGLGDEARINVPGVPTGNWTWQMTARQLEQLKKGGIL